MTLYDRFGGHLRSAQPLWYPPNVETAALRAASPYLLNQQGSPQIPGCTAASQQPWASGMVQPFPLTAQGVLDALGNPAGWTVANVLAVYNCDTATPLVDSLGLGPNLVAAGGPLTQRECVGLPGATFNSKVGCEFTAGGQSFAAGVNAFADANASVVSFLLVTRGTGTLLANGEVIGKFGGAPTGWALIGVGAAVMRLNVFGAGGGAQSDVAFTHVDHGGVWHCWAAYIDDLGRSARLFSDVGDGAVANYVGSASVATPLSLGSGAWYGNPNPGQTAYLACFSKAITSAMRATFWRAFAPAALGTPNTYTRANPLVGNISAGRVACYAANQLPIMYDGGFLADGNPEYTGIMVHEGVTFLGINSANLAAYADSGTTHAGADGPSGMRDAIRITQTVAFVAPNTNTCYCLAPAPLAGATAVPFKVGAMAQQGTVGSSLRVALAFQGDPGGIEGFLSISTDALPAAYRRLSNTTTPVGNAHNGVFVGASAGAVANNVDFAEPYLIQNSSVDVLAWRRAALVSAATSTPTLSMTNVGNRRYNPAKGTIEITLSNFRGPSGGALTPTFLQYGAAAAAGSLTLDFSGGNLRLRGWNSAAALAFTVLCGPSVIDQDEWRVRICWQATSPIPGIAGAYVSVERINAGASPTLLGTWAGSWTPQVADVTPLMAGCDAAGANAARCLIALA